MLESYSPVPPSLTLFSVNWKFVVVVIIIYFESGSFYIILAILELSVMTSLALNP